MRHITLNGLLPYPYSLLRFSVKFYTSLLPSDYNMSKHHCVNPMLLFFLHDFFRCQMINLFSCCHSYCATRGRSLRRCREFKDGMNNSPLVTTTTSILTSLHRPFLGILLWTTTAFRGIPCLAGTAFLPQLTSSWEGSEFKESAVARNPPYQFGRFSDAGGHRC